MCTMCPPTRASWRHLIYMTEIVFPSAHPSPQPKRQIDRFSHFCTALGRVSSGMPGHVFSHNNCPFQWGIWAPSIHASLHPTESITQMVSRSVQPFLHRSRQSVAIYGPPPCPLKLPLPTRDLDTYLTHDSLGPFEPTAQTASRSVQPFLHRRSQSVSTLYNGTPLLVGEDLDHSSNTVPWAHPSPQPKRYLDRFSRFFARLTSVRDRQTDRQTTLISR